MSFSSSSDSMQDQLTKRKIGLAGQSQNLTKEINKMKLTAESYQHDLLMAQEAYQFQESGIITRTKKLASLFGCQLQNDEDLIRKIAELKESCENEEKEAERLKSEIARIQSLRIQHSENTSQISSDARKLKHGLIEVKNELTMAEQKLHLIQNQIQSKEKERDLFFKTIKPISKQIEVSPTDPIFFTRLDSKLHSPNVSYMQKFVPISKVTKIRLPEANDFNASRYLKKVRQQIDLIHQEIAEKQQYEEKIFEKIESSKARTALLIDSEKEIQANIQSISDNQKSQEIMFQTQIKENEQAMKSRIQAVRNNELRLYSSLLNNETPKSSNEAIDILIRNLSNLVLRLSESRAPIELNPKITEGIQAIDSAAETIAMANRHLIRKFK